MGFLTRHDILRNFLAAATICLLGNSASGADTAPQKAPPPRPFVTEAPTPSREQAYIAIVDKARHDYLTAKSAEGRVGARTSLQITVHQFMGLTHEAQDWVGIYQGSQVLSNGNRSFGIWVAPDVLIATWESPAFDSQYDTMIKPYEPIAHVLDGLYIGDAVMFSANLLGNAISSDEEMVLHPRIIAKFTKLKKLDPPVPAKP
jgi:hypothetical protein